MAPKGSDKKASREPMPKDAQKGGQGAVGKDNPGAELNQKGHPAGGANKE